MAKLGFFFAIALLGVPGIVEMVKFDEYVEICRMEQNRTSEEVRKIMGPIHKEYDEKIGCFYKCLGEKIGMLDANGRFVSNKYIELVKQTLGASENEKESIAQLDAKMEVCKDIDEGNACLNAFKIDTCLRSKLGD